MNFTLQVMVDAFERTSLDDRLHIIMRSDEDLEVCIEFNRDDQFRCWTFYFRDAREESKQNCSRTHAVEVARAFNLSESGLAKELAGHLLTQAAFADQFVREMQELLGLDAVRESIMRTQLFMDALKEAVSSALSDNDELSNEDESLENTPPAESFPPPADQPLKLRVIKGS
ncbi:hypothetical protein EBU99_12430 [bacterium]|nr:hypothetical protein [bacterium]